MWSAAGREARGVFEPRQVLGRSTSSLSGVAGIGEVSAHQDDAAPEALGSHATPTLGPGGGRNPRNASISVAGKIPHPQTGVCQL